MLLNTIHLHVTVASLLPQPSKGSSNILILRAQSGSQYPGNCATCCAMSMQGLFRGRQLLAYIAELLDDVPRGTAACFFVGQSGVAARQRAWLATGGGWWGSDGKVAFFFASVTLHPPPPFFCLPKHPLEK
jgi:hypothetical protein